MPPSWSGPNANLAYAVCVFRMAQRSTVSDKSFLGFSVSLEILGITKNKTLLPFALCAVLLSGCKTVENVAAQIAIGIVLDPVFDATVEGGKAAYVATEEYWANHDYESLN